MKPKLVKELPLAEQETMSCIFCSRKEDDEFLFGQFYTIGKQHLSLTVHYYCLLFASGLEQKGKDSQGIFGFMKKDILNAAERGKLIECHKCHATGATVGCADTTCERIYHFPCTPPSRMINQYFGEFKSFCTDHRPIQKVPDSFLGKSQATCIICQEEVPNPEPSYDLLWAPCCKKQSWFHRDCIQRLALSAGCHFFKCPICSSSDLFLKEMQEMGIYVPDQDASWEVEPHAFRELYHRHNQCDHPTCICPRGRSYVGRLWKLMLCSSCGSKGLHASCGNLDTKRNEWNCENCRQVAALPGESSSQSQGNPSNKAPSGSAALKRPRPARKERSGASNNDDVSEDESEVLEVISAVPGPSSSAHSSPDDRKPSCSTDDAHGTPRKVRIAEQQRQLASGPLNQHLTQAIQNTVAVRAGSSGSTQLSVANDIHQEKTASAALSESDHTNSSVGDHQQDRRIQADNQEEKTNGQAAPIVNRPSNLTKAVTKPSTEASPPRTTVPNQGPSPVEITDPPPDYLTSLLNTLEGYFRLQDLEQISKILMHFYSGDRDCPILKHLMLVLIKRPVIALDGAPIPEKECSAGAITATIINFIKQQVGSSKLDEFPKLKCLLLDLYSYAFLHLYERDQNLIGAVKERRKEDNMLDTFQLASSLSDFSEELADCMENQPQLLLFAAECSARAGMKKGAVKCIMTAFFFLEKFNKSLEAVTDSELKAHLIEKERDISKLIRDVKSIPNANEHGSDSGGSLQVPSCKEPQDKVFPIKRALRAANYPKILAAKRLLQSNNRSFPNSSYKFQEAIRNTTATRNYEMPPNSNYSLERSGPSADGGVRVRQREYATNWHQGMGQSQYNIGMPPNSSYNNLVGSGPSAGEGIPSVPVQLRERPVDKDRDQGMGIDQNNIGIPPKCPSNREESDPSAGEGVPLVASQQNGNAVNKDQDQEMGKGQNNTGMIGTVPDCNSNLAESGPLDGGGFLPVPFQQSNLYQNRGMGHSQNNIGMPHNRSYNVGSDPSTDKWVPPVPSQQREHTANWNQHQGPNNCGMPYNRSYNDPGSGSSAGGGVPPVSFQQSSWSQNQGMRQGQYDYGMPPNYYYKPGCGPSIGYGFSPVPFQQADWDQDQGMGQGQYDYGMPPNFSYNLAGSYPSAGGVVPSIPSQQRERTANWNQSHGRWQGQNNTGMHHNSNYNYVGSGPSAGNWVHPVPNEQHEHPPNRHRGMGHGQNNMRMPPYSSYNREGSGPSSAYSAGEGIPSWHRNQEMEPGQNNGRMPRIRNYNNPSAGGGPTLQWRPVPIPQREQSVINWCQNQGIGLDQFHQSFTCLRCNGFGHIARNCPSHNSGDSYGPRPNNRTIKIEIPFN